MKQGEESVAEAMARLERRTGAETGDSPMKLAILSGFISGAYLVTEAMERCYNESNRATLPRRVRTRIENLRHDLRVATDGICARAKALGCPGLH